MRVRLRTKNFRPRFLPFYALGLAAFWFAEPTPRGLLVGGSLVAAGAALRSWGAGHLVKNYRLTVTGPYAYMRHPLYAGTLLACVGFAITLGGWLSPFLVASGLGWFFLAYFPRKERVESARLEERYAGAYVRYREQVHALVPSLSPWRPPPEFEECVESQGHWSGVRYDDNDEIGTLLALGLGVLAMCVRTLLAS